MAIRQSQGQKPRLLRSDPAQWDEGFIEGEAGKPAPACQSRSYYSGWIEGHIKRQGYSYCLLSKYALWPSLTEALARARDPGQMELVKPEKTR